MPTYDYICPACGYEFEAFQTITDGALRKCPQCKHLKLKRLIGSGAGIIFKGTGFYETDYRSKSYMEGQRKDSSAATPTTSGSSKKTSSGSSKTTSSGGNGSASTEKPADSKAQADPSKGQAKKAS